MPFFGAVCGAVCGADGAGDIGTQGRRERAYRAAKQPPREAAAGGAGQAAGAVVFGAFRENIPGRGPSFPLLPGADRAGAGAGGGVPGAGGYGAGAGAGVRREMRRKNKKKFIQENT